MRKGNNSESCTAIMGQEKESSCPNEKRREWFYGKTYNPTIEGK